MSAGEAPRTGDTSTRAVDRALLLLTNVLTGEAGDTLSALARSADLSPSTASRLLGTLVRHGLVKRDDYGRYAVGSRMKQLSAAALRDEPLYDLVGPHLEQLVEASGETASLGAPAGPDEVLYLRQHNSRRHQVQTVVWTGRTVPRTGTALGRALDGDVLPGGYVLSRRPDSDIAAVAAPIFGHHGEIPAAISINAPAYRTSDEDLHRFGALLVEHAEQLSTGLGAPVEEIRRQGFFGG